MIARLRARLHGMRRGHQVHDEMIQTTPLVFNKGEFVISRTPGVPSVQFTDHWAAPTRWLPTGAIRCHGCERRWTP